MNQDVIDKRSLRIKHGRILRLTDGQLRCVIHRESLNRSQRARPAKLNIAHVADVEKPHRGADRHVLRGDAGVLDWHIPASEIDHFGAEPAVDTIERRLAQSGRGDRIRGSRHDEILYREMAYLTV